jgi:hypothetical protein
MTRYLPVASSLRCPDRDDGAHPLGGAVTRDGKCVDCHRAVSLGRRWANRNRASARGRLHTQLSYDGEA